MDTDQHQILSIGAGTSTEYEAINLRYDPNETRSGKDLATNRKGLVRFELDAFELFDK